MLFNGSKKRFDDCNGSGVAVSVKSTRLLGKRSAGQCTTVPKKSKAEIRKSLSSIILHDMCLDAPQARR